MKSVKWPIGLRRPKQFNANEFYSKDEQNFIQSRKSYSNAPCQSITTP